MASDLLPPGRNCCSRPFAVRGFLPAVAITPTVFGPRHREGRVSVPEQKPPRFPRLRKCLCHSKSARSCCLSIPYLHVLRHHSGPNGLPGCGATRSLYPRPPPGANPETRSASRPHIPELADLMDDRMKTAWPDGSVSHRMEYPHARQSARPQRARLCAPRPPSESLIGVFQLGRSFVHAFVRGALILEMSRATFGGRRPLD